jgi:hypothetical protein
MDRKYIEDEHIVDRYLSGELSVREAREFELFCVDHPQYVNTLPIPVRVRARLARRPVEETEAGEFANLPSSASRVAMEVVEEGFDPEEAREEMRRSFAGEAINRTILIALLAAVLVAATTAVIYVLKASALTEQLQTANKDLTAVQMQPPGRQQRYRIQPIKGKPAQPTVALGWLDPAELLDITIDATEGKMTQFQITVDKTDGVRVMQIKRMMRDSNKELRMSLNSSAFGPGNYLVRIDAYNWRGQTQEYGWFMLGLQ